MHRRYVDRAETTADEHGLRRFGAIAAEGLA
jgi:hypothetical protein